MLERQARGDDPRFRAVPLGASASSKGPAAVSRRHGIFPMPARRLLLVVAALLAISGGALDYPDRYTAQVNRDDDTRHMGVDEDRSTVGRSDILAR